MQMLTGTWQDMWTRLGIDDGLISACELPLCEDAKVLVSAGLDVFEREQFVTGSTLECWLSMKAAAADDDVSLDIVSAFRSIDYQCELIQNKLTKGLTIQEILLVNAIPGFSEHHTGRAIDITTTNCEPLSESFESTPAFKWLTKNAGLFSFEMSYPRDNPYNIIYEPWHWMCQLTD